MTEANCPECGQSCASEHGVKVHMGMTYETDDEQTVSVSERDVTLATVGKLIDESLERLTGKDASEEWTTHAANPDELEEVLQDKAAELSVEMKTRIPTGYHPSPQADSTRSFQ